MIWKRKIVIWLTAICMIASMLPSIGAFAAKDKTYLMDTNDTGSIEEAGYSADSGKTNSTKYSVKWETDALKEFRIKSFPKDISMHSVINFSLFIDSPTGDEATLMVYIGSENNSTTGIDYYSRELKVKPGEWKSFSINYAELSINREPLGFDNVDEIRLTVAGWSNKVAAGSVIYVENMYLSGDPTTVKGFEKPEKVDPATIFDETAPVGDRLHYNFAGFETEDITIGGYAKTNRFEIITDRKKTNHYLICEILDSASDCHWDLNLTDPTRYMVFDFDVSTDSTLPYGFMQFKDMEGVSAGSLLSFNAEVITLLDGQEIKVRKGKWINIAIVCDLLNNTQDVYVDGEKVIEDYKFSDSTSLSMVRFYFMPNNNVGTTMLFDNYKIYEGSEPREVSNDAVANKIPKIVMNNSAAQQLLKDVVALSVGGNGIHYGGEKQPIDAPAYIDNGRTLIPVRAVSEAFGLDVAWDEATRTVTVDGKSKIVIDSVEMILPDGSGYTLDVPAKITNGRTFIPLRALCEQILGKTVTWNDKGIIIISDKEFAVTDSNADTINNYLLYDRPTKEQITESFNTYNNNSHPRIMMDRERYNQIVYNYQTDPEVKKWGDYVIKSADNDLTKALPRYTIPDTVELLVTSRDVYQRAQNLSMAYILTKDAKYAEGLFDVLEAAGKFPGWNPAHFLDVAEMTAAFAIGYDWLYDYWSESQKVYLENSIYKFGVSVMLDSHYGNLSAGGLGAGNVTNWNVVCNGGTIMGAVAVFDKYPEECADMIAISLRDLEAMMDTFYPDGAWNEGIGYWEYTLAYTVNLFSTLEACFGTDFNLSKAPGFSNTINFYMAGDGSVGINNFHDSAVVHGSTNTYFWLSNKFNMPGVTNVRLYQLEKGVISPTAFDILWYDTAIKGTDFYLPKDTYLRGVEFVAMRQSWTDDNGAWLSYHGGESVANHSHLDTGTFVFDLAGIRWAQDMGGDNYYLPDYFTSGKHKYYRLRPEGHNVYVISPDDKEGQTLNHFATVETLVSKERGAYSILDMTPAYSPWVNSARRGYMLADDRRSGVVRDEIEFNQAGREFIWFMHTPHGAKITIEDKNTAYITSEGVTLKFMIDSDIENYEFGVMDASPLPTSPNPSGQSTNKGIKKLYLKGIAGASNYVECKMILADDPASELPLSKTSLDEWQIPDGVIQEIPVVDMISVNGTDIADFDSGKVTYSRTINYDDTSTVEITARAAEGLNVEVTYGETYKDTVRIKVSYADNPDVFRVYSYQTIVIPKLNDLADYTRIQVAAHSASAEPEKEHPATNVSDNNTDPESRWAAEGSAWLVLDLGSETEIDAVGISAWKGTERVYTFKVEVSSDGESWSEVIAERETTTAYGENIGVYDFEGGAVSARYVRYSGKGNTVNDWNSLMEIAALKKNVNE